VFQRRPGGKRGGKEKDHPTRPFNRTLVFQKRDFIITLGKQKKRGKLVPWHSYWGKESYPGEEGGVSKGGIEKRALKTHPMRCLRVRVLNREKVGAKKKS